MADEFDLFGDPVQLPNGRRGRPAHVATQKNRNKVMVLLAMGWSKERIANAVHCSKPTLDKYYFSELKRRDIQRDRLDAWRLEIAIEEAGKGNIGAQRLLDQMITKNDAMLAADRMRNLPADVAPEKLGKKELARRRAAELVGDDAAGAWGSDLRPGNWH